MNMRVGWTLATIAALEMALAAGPAWSQGGPNNTAAGGAAGAQAAAAGTDPAALAMAQAYQAQAYQMQAYQMMAAQQAAMYGPAAMYGQPAMYAQPGMQPVAYSQGPASVMVQPQAPGPFPGGATPDVYGAYGYAPTDYGAPGGQPGYGQPGAAPSYGPGGAPGYGPDGYGGAPAYDQSGYAGGGQMGDGSGYGPNCDPNSGSWGLPGCEVNGQHLPNGLIGDCLGLIAPYPDGGCAAPRWYDFAFDYMMLKRDNTGRSQDFTSNGINGPIVLSTNDLNFGQFRPGFRFSAAFQLMAANSLEFTYFGQFNFTSQAAVTSPTGNLFSVFTGFPVNPFLIAAFPEFSSANFQQISYQSTFDSFEINWRKRWMAPNCRYQGSWTLGVRHFILDEKFRFSSSSTANGFLPQFGAFVPARGQDDTDTTNDLTGFQIGTDAWVCLLPGLRIGGEFQGGVYGNHMNINTTVGSNLTSAQFREKLQSNDVSFIGQANLLATYRFNYQWSGRIGYQFLYVDGVALASENFNATPPLVSPLHVPRLNDNGNVFYHGWNVGLEYMW
ncbi:MAG TPA: hypothetical protein VGI40_15380 [Pirellulaceae bacterium]|jgi:hypothetical protein